MSKINPEDLRLVKELEQLRQKMQPFINPETLLPFDCIEVTAIKAEMTEIWIKLLKNAEKERTCPDTGLPVSC